MSKLFPLIETPFDKGDQYFQITVIPLVVVYIHLMLSMLAKNSRRGHFEIVFLLFPENKTLHEMWMPIF